jgi:tetratricopeptide (TPR) repeat protein
MVAGVAAEAGGDFKAAQNDYARALEIYPSFVAGARQLAILDGKHFPEDAKGYAWAEKARNAYPDDFDVARSLGILSFFQAKYSRSTELLEETVAKSHDDGELYYYLGMDYYQLKRNREGKQALGRALALKISDTMAVEAKRVLNRN